MSTSALTTKQQCVLMAARDGEKIEDGTTRSVRMPAHSSVISLASESDDIQYQMSASRPLCADSRRSGNDYEYSIPRNVICGVGWLYGVGRIRFLKNT